MLLKKYDMNGWRKVRVYKVGDADKYGIKFGKWYNYELIMLINKQLKLESKAIIKTVVNNADFDNQF